MEVVIIQLLSALLQILGQMSSLVAFLLVSAGATNILTLGRIFKPLRPKHHVFHCPMCIGFWVGLLFWWLSQYTGLFTFDAQIATGIFLGFASSIASWILGYLGKYLEVNS